MKASFHSQILALLFLVMIAGFIELGIPLTSAWVKQAQNLIGLQLTDDEIDSLLPELEDQLKTYIHNRGLDLNNEITPALEFDPVPKDYRWRSNKAKPVFTPFPVSLPEQTELAFLTVHQLGAMIKAKKITSVALTRYFIDRLKKFDPDLKFVVNFTEEYALAQAAILDKELNSGRYRGMLHGIPYGAKDLLSKKGYPTTWGSVPFKEQTFDYDAAVIKKLEDAGGVLIAKMSVGELAWGDVWFGGMTRNPWDPTTGSSGSSAGSASAVSAGCLPFAIGTETLGSIVSPSTVCGTTGLRPTYGAVPGEGCMKLCPSMDKIGPITRTVEDAAIVFQYIKGDYSSSGQSGPISFPFQYNKNIRTLKIGYLKNDFDRAYPFHQNDSLALEVFRANGVELIPIDLPESPDMSIILSAESGASFDELTRSGKDDLMVRQIRNAWPNVFRASRFIPAVEYIQANRLRSILLEHMEKMLKKADVYLAPSFSGKNLNITNYSGHPCVVLPNGFRNKKPTSISFIGKLFHEDEVLAVAKFYQDHTSWHHQHPDISQ